MPPAPEYPFSERVASLRSSAIREILRVTNRPEVISFAGGLPAPELFPSEALAALAASLLGSPRGRAALQYSETEGHEGLRTRILERVPFPAGRFALEGALVTQGSQQGLDLLAKLFLDRGDEVLVETPAYVGALQVFRFFGAKIGFLPCDADGVLPGPLADALRRRPKLVYLTPTFQNPSGVCYPERRRTEVREALRGSEAIVVEDDPYRDIWFDAPPPPPVVAAHDPDRSVYLGSFSKTAVPGLRIGFLLGPPPIVRRCVLAKQATDLQTNSLGQHLVHDLLAHPGFERHVADLRAAYRARRDVLERALAARLAGALRWNRPGGGMFLWARLADGGDAADLLVHALEEGLAFVPGGEFHPEGEGKDTLRLNFTHSSEERLAEGVERLSRAFVRWRAAGRGAS
jgi:DNA-binding transcriptional MocR family regulator